MTTVDAIAGDVPTFAELKAAVFTARESLARGQVIYHVEGTASLPEERGGPPRQQKYVQDMTVWFDGDRLREDRRHDDGHRAVSCFGCLPDRMHVYYDNERLPRGTMALVVTDYSETQPVLHGVVDPRWIGLHPTELKVNVHFPPEMVRETFWREVPPGNARITQDRIGDIDCWRAEWHCVNNVDIKMTAWIASASAQILRFKEDYEQWGQKWSFSLEEEIGTVRGGDGKDYHVPVRLDFKRYIDSQLHDSEIAEIQYVSLNEPLDERIFSLEGIDFINPGTPVVWASERNRPGEEGELVWDGERIAVTRLGTEEMAGRLSFSPVRSLLLFGTLGVCAALLIWYFVRRIKAAR